MWGSQMISNYAKSGAGGLGKMMGTALGKRTLAGAGVGAAMGGYMGGFSGALAGGVMGAGGGRYGGSAYAHRGLGTSAAMRSGAGLFKREMMGVGRGASIRANSAYNSVASSLKNWSTS